MPDTFTKGNRTITAHYRGEALDHATLAVSGRTVETATDKDTVLRWLTTDDDGHGPL